MIHPQYTRMHSLLNSLQDDKVPIKYYICADVHKWVKFRRLERHLNDT